MKRAIGILLLLAVVAVSVVIYWRYAISAAQSDAVPELLRYAPADAKALVYLDVAALRGSAFAADLAALGPAQKPDPEYLEFVKATGFDYSRDLDRVLFVVREVSPAQVGLALAEGRFDQAKIEAYAARSGKLARANGTDIYEIPQAASGEAIALAFFGTNRIVFAQGPAARARLDTFLQRVRQTTMDAEMHTRLLRVAGSPIFVTGQVDQLAAAAAARGLRSDQLNNLMGSMRWATLGIRPEGELLRVAADGECTTAENAHQLAGTLDGLQMLAQSVLNDPNTRAKLEPQVAALLDAALRDLRVSQDGSRVRLTLELTHDQLRDLLRTQPAAPSTGR